MNQDDKASLFCTETNILILSYRSSIYRLCIVNLNDSYSFGFISWASLGNYDQLNPCFNTNSINKYNSIINLV